MPCTRCPKRDICSSLCEEAEAVLASNAKTEPAMVYLHGTQLELACREQPAALSFPRIIRLERLTRLQRYIVRMTLAGFTQEEIAEVRSCSRFSVARTLTRARRRLAV